MKASCAALALLFAFGHLAHATETRCVPEDRNSRWREAQVTELENSSLGLYKVRAVGGYLAADLICNSDCVGFVNGFDARGKMEFMPTGELAAFSIATQVTDLIPVVRFVCQ